MLGFIRDLFWSAFGSTEPEPVQVKPPVLDLTSDDDSDVPALFPQDEPKQAVYKNNELQALCELYGDKAGSSAHRLLRPLFPSESLGDSSWLDDRCITDFLEVLVKNYEKQGLKLAFVDSLKSDVDGRGFLIDKWKSGLYQKDKERLSQADLIFCPVNLLGNHWGLWVLDKRNEHNPSVYCLDGFNSNPFADDVSGYAARQKINFDRYITPLAAEMGIDASQSYHHYVPEQGNNIDCGAVICYWAKQICDNVLTSNSPIDVEFEAKDYTDYRLEIAKMILSHQPDTVAKRSAPDTGFDDEQQPSLAKKSRLSLQ